jgi:hypothetical protein
MCSSAGQPQARYAAMVMHAPSIVETYPVKITIFVKPHANYDKKVV